MPVRLKKKAAAPKPAKPDGVLGGTPPLLPEDVDQALLAVLMYFPHQLARFVASDLALGWLNYTPGRIKWLVDRIEEFDQALLEKCDPNYNVMKALKTLQKHAGPKAEEPPKSMYEKAKPSRPSVVDECPAKPKGKGLRKLKIIRKKGATGRKIVLKKAGRPKL
jgi:hypothetical protein